MPLKSTLHEPPDSPLDLTMPLVNLHSHLEGSIRPATYLELCQAMDLPAPNSLEEAQALLSVDGSETCLHDYLERITPVGPILKSAAALERTSYEAAEDARRDGVAYFELRAGPLLHLTPTTDTAAAIEAMLHGILEAERALGITARLIVCALRAHDAPDNEALARVAVRYAGRGVVGFDLAGDEKGYPAWHHARAYAIAAAGGLGLTCHAGEGEGSASIVAAVETLGARRIGHGIHLDDTPGRVAGQSRRGWCWRSAPPATWTPVPCPASPLIQCTSCSTPGCASASGTTIRPPPAPASPRAAAARAHLRLHRARAAADPAHRP